jgi:hypothetical protein
VGAGGVQIVSEEVESPIDDVVPEHSEKKDSLCKQFSVIFNQ